jgi:hypothetical protein
LCEFVVIETKFKSRLKEIEIKITATELVVALADFFAEKSSRCSSLLL